MFYYEYFAKLRNIRNKYSQATIFYIFLCFRIIINLSQKNRIFVATKQ